MTDWRIINGDCVESMAAMPEASVDAIVCDPPYGLEFMGKDWDRLWSAPDNSFDVRPKGGASPYNRERASYGTDTRRMQEWHETWAREAFRVLKPGGHLLAFGGTRTYHRLACAIEDAGFEIRDTISWMYGSGFPKSLDVGKAIDRAAGAEREVVGQSCRPVNHDPSKQGVSPFSTSAWRWGDESYTDWDAMPRKARDYFTAANAARGQITAPATLEARQWQGWGTALKPAHEPIVVARKPLAGTVSANVLEHGTGALNIDGCRVGSGERPVMVRTDTVVAASSMSGESTGATSNGEVTTQGRWPANVVLSHTEDCQQVGTRKVKSEDRSRPPRTPSSVIYGHGKGPSVTSSGQPVADSMETHAAWSCSPSCPVRLLNEQTGEQTSRFFYTAKSSSSERNAGLDGFEEQQVAVPALAGPGRSRGGDTDERGKQLTPPRANSHPTVKPIELMRWLVRLVCPPGGTVLDPFTGSGTTGAAAVLEGFDFVGIEQDESYVEIAKARIAWWAEHPDGMKLVHRLEAEQERKATLDAGQLDLFGGA